MSANKMAATLHDGTQIFYSYGTIIGYKRPNHAGVFTDKQYSRTTSGHRNQFMREFGGMTANHEAFLRLYSAEVLPALAGESSGVGGLLCEYRAVCACHAVLHTTRSTVEGALYVLGHAGWEVRLGAIVCAECLAKQG